MARPLRPLHRLLICGGFVCALACAQDREPAAPIAEAVAPPATANAAPATAREPAPTPPAETREQIAARLHKGIDISRHSGIVDWPQVLADGHTFAFAKATEGVDLEDSSFAAHWQSMPEAGIIRGAYHFYVTEDDPLEQANFFISKVDLRSGDLVPVVDLELIGHGTQPGLIERVSLFLTAIETHYGVKPMIYTSPNFWDQHMNDAFGEYPLWIAQYDVDQPRLPVGWDAWHLWQWRGDAQIAGVEKDVDLSHANRDHEDLAALVVP